MPEEAEKKEGREAGAVYDQMDFEILVRTRRATPHRLTDATVMPRGDKFTFAYLEDHGIAVFSHQTAKTFVIPLLDLIKVGQARGLEKESPLIILPGREASRG